jgi:WhiB family redox-sensing transcriptional regulator
MTVIIPEWQNRAACLDADPDMFFECRGRDAAKPAKAICADCPVQRDCLDYALDEHIVFGIWGGLTREERRIYKRKLTHV